MICEVKTKVSVVALIAMLVGCTKAPLPHATQDAQDSARAASAAVNAPTEHGKSITSNRDDAEHP